MAVLRAKQKEVEAIEAQLEKMMNELKVPILPVRDTYLMCINISSWDVPIYVYSRLCFLAAPRSARKAARRSIHLTIANKLFSNPTRPLSNSTFYVILQPVVEQLERLSSNPITGGRHSNGPFKIHFLNNFVTGC